MLKNENALIYWYIFIFFSKKVFEECDIWWISAPGRLQQSMKSWQHRPPNVQWLPCSSGLFISHLRRGLEASQRLKSLEISSYNIFRKPLRIRKALAFQEAWPLPVWSHGALGSEAFAPWRSWRGFRFSKKHIVSEKKLKRNSSV